MSTTIDLITDSSLQTMVEKIQKQTDELAKAVIDDNIVTELEDARHISNQKKYATIGSALRTEASLINDAITNYKPYYKCPSVLIKTNEVTTVSIKLKGQGDVVIDFGFGSNRETYLLTDTEQVITHAYLGVPTERTIVIINAQNITSINVMDNNICSLDVQDCTNLEELICCNNSLSSLSLNSDNLRILHIMNNPLCKDTTAMSSLCNELPDRNGRSFGSIIMYDFVGYGEIETDEHKSLVDLRKDLESITISKDWYFGSAIIYNFSEYAKTTDSFKASNIAAIWESAEQGEGIVLGFNEIKVNRDSAEWSTSNFAGTAKMVDNNTYAIVDWTSSAATSTTYKTYFHSNATASIAIANGRNYYGMIPKAKLYEVRKKNSKDNRDKEMAACIKHLAENCDIISLSQCIPSYTLLSTSDYENTKYEFSSSEYNGALKNAIDNNIPIIYSSGNHGDGINETFDTLLDWAYVNVPDIICVGAFSNYNTMTEDSATETSAIDIADSYIVNVYDSDTGKWGKGADTSFSTVEVSSKMALYMNLFKKKYDRKPSNAELVDFIKTRSVNVPNISRYIVGNGYIDFMGYNYFQLYHKDIEGITNVEESYNLNTGNILSVTPTAISNYSNNLALKTEYNSLVSFVKYNNKIYGGTGNSHIHVYSLDNPSIYIDVPVSIEKPSEQLSDITTATMLFDNSVTLGTEIEGLTNYKEFTVQMRIKDYVINDTDMLKYSTFFTIVDDNASTTNLKYLTFYDGNYANVFGFYLMDGAGAFGDVVNSDWGGIDLSTITGDVVITVTCNMTSKNFNVYVQGAKIGTINISKSTFITGDKIVIGTVPIYTDDTKTLHKSTLGKTRVYSKVLSESEVFTSTMHLLTEQD